MNGASLPVDLQSMRAQPTFIAAEMNQTPRIVVQSAANNAKVIQQRDCAETIKSKNTLTVLLCILLVVSLGTSIYYAIATRDSALPTIQKILICSASASLLVCAFVAAIVLFWQHRDRVACSVPTPSVKTI